MSSTDNIIILKSSDGESFEVKEAVARRSPTISHLIDGGIPDDGIHLQKVTGKILSKVIEYCEMHVVDGDDLKAWDAEFVKVDQATLFDLILAAKYLDIKGLLDLGCGTVAEEIKSRPPEELRELFSIKNNFEPEEEEEVRRETHWKFE